MDFSEGLDCLNHELLITKMSAYGFSRPALKLISSYLHKRQQRIKISHFETDLSMSSSRLGFGTPAFQYIHLGIPLPGE